MESRRPTQKDVAAKAGVHRATVSLAFKQHPSIPVATRERIFRAAEEVGYQPDPMLSALASYRGRMQKRSYQGTLAWLVVSSEQYYWKAIETFRLYYEGAKSRAISHGYQLEVFELDKNVISPKRIASIFRARNINGVLLCPQPEGSSVIDFPWDHFCFVTFGYSLIKPALHTVTSTQFRAMAQTMRQMHQLGYRKIAFAFHRSHDERADHNFLAGYLAAQYQIGEKPIVFDYEWENMHSFHQWVWKNRPEAVVIGDNLVLRHLDENKLSIPENIGLACPLLYTNKSNLAGVFEDSFHIGEVAIDQLTTMVMRGQRGIPKRVQRLHIEGVWSEGKTLPPLIKKP
ncbi:LacI family DNA-binding transcriptional regulator [Cerasicoccus arenae]|nr:LacI family DNA-binding transcriptional regulator [Cerasicoccus arenae]MBK1858122.1 LacI family DNA-binding transcriptional regulator [Cerasicoccus arenae]